MRMWNVNPRKMCMNHLLGEHVEMHMFVGCIEKGISLQGYLDNQLVEIHNIKKRHEELVQEMKRRGMNHKSKLELPVITNGGYVDKKQNIIELRGRCLACSNL